MIVRPLAINAFIDTHTIVVMHPFSVAFLNVLHGLCDGVVERPWPDYRVIRRLYRKKNYAAIARLKKLGYKWEYVIQLPTTECLYALNIELSGEDYLLTGVDVALNHTFLTWAEANWCCEYLFAHLVKENGESSFSTGANNPRKKSKGCAPAFYLQYDRDPRTVQICVYADKPCAIDGEHCSHLEFRLPSTQRVRAAGIRTIHDLITFDYREFFRRRLRIRALHFASIGRMYRGRMRSRQRDAGTWGVDLNARAGRTLSSVAKHKVAERLIEAMISRQNSSAGRPGIGYEEGINGSKRYSTFLAEFPFLPVQGILNVLAEQPWFNRRHAVTVIDNTPFLPGSANTHTATGPTPTLTNVGGSHTQTFRFEKEVSNTMIVRRSSR